MFFSSVCIWCCNSSLKMFKHPHTVPFSPSWPSWLFPIRNSRYQLLLPLFQLFRNQILWGYLFQSVFWGNRPFHQRFVHEANRRHCFRIWLVSSPVNQQLVSFPRVHFFSDQSSLDSTTIKGNFLPVICETKSY